ncbi:unnamed protein product [Rotaria sordida]|uniref:Uncharacterized protein n=1 Tax=Rotaria sordida TaxID=392033 RepID=A0A815DUY7_9BILA|nr:unnamed protein product [Rotaria sordida]CAF1179160.1 unnamed protein product [Rotaria sordida]CAF1192463.1 unnamed protein product [Rotaria sordida]CAF1302444.1 unnamed protein product [Rotaria sordida]CAF1438930.1 unnamed protein product [Rotaria sordida]
MKEIGLQTIRELASIVFQQEVFLYDEKIYKQNLTDTKGASLTLTLANIFIWEWQTEFVRRADISNEIYGRKTLPSLDIHLTNNNGILSTSVYHKPAVKPYVVPFISDYSRHIFGNIVQTAITQGLHYLSTYAAFNYE